MQKLSKVFQLKLKVRLAIVNTVSKLVIAALVVFLLPTMVSRISVNNTDEVLIDKLDRVLYLVDSLGIRYFIDEESNYQGFGSYNILKDEFISIEPFASDSLIESIGFSQRIVEGEQVDYRVLSYSLSIDSAYYLIEIGKSLETIFFFESNLRTYALWLVISLLLITLLFDLSFAQWILRPLDSIVAKLKTTRHHQEFDYTVIPTSTSDFNYLQEAINGLMKKIDDAFNKEREFITNVSHELLTPITIIQSKLDALMADRSLSHDDLRKVYESKQTLVRLTRMVKTLLMMSRIENDEYLLDANVDVIAVLKTVHEELLDRIEAKGLNGSLQIDIQKYSIQANSDLLFNLFYNLLNNAIKYTAEGTIGIKAAVEHNQLLVEISDTGAGIPPEKLNQVFQRFHTTATDGSSFGIGLALVKKIAEYHKIEFTVEANHPQGSVFKMIF